MTQPYEVENRDGAGEEAEVEKWLTAYPPKDRSSQYGYKYLGKFRPRTREELQSSVVHNFPDVRLVWTPERERMAHPVFFKELRNYCVDHSIFYGTAVSIMTGFCFFVSLLPLCAAGFSRIFTMQGLNSFLLLLVTAMNVMHMVLLKYSPAYRERFMVRCRNQEIKKAKKLWQKQNRWPGNQEV